MDYLEDGVMPRFRKLPVAQAAGDVNTGVTDDDRKAAECVAAFRPLVDLPEDYSDYCIERDDERRASRAAARAHRDYSP